jgi:hypothetical protein
VIDDELALPFEDLAERLPALLALERVLFLDQLPRQVATLFAELVAKASGAWRGENQLGADRHLGGGRQVALPGSSFSRLDVRGSALRANRDRQRRDRR